MFAALDERLDALLHGAAVVDLGDELPESLELAQLVATARLTMDALEESLSPATQARHLKMLEAHLAPGPLRSANHDDAGPGVSRQDAGSAGSGPAGSEPRSRIE